MAIERFNAGEPVSAQKFNTLVCALNNLCTSARNLQRGQTLPLGANNRPRRFYGSAGCGGSGCGTCFDVCVCHRVVRRSPLPPFGVIALMCRPDGTEFIVNAGHWKFGSGGATLIGGGHVFTGRRYIYARNDGAIALSDCEEYDHRFYRLLADVQTWCSPCFTIGLCGEAMTARFPKQLWSGDICQPIPKWSQSGVFRSCVTREGKLNVYNGLAYIESPLAVAGKRVMKAGCRGDPTVVDCACTLRIVQGYYPVPDATLDIPKEDLVLMLRYKSCSDPEFENAAGIFEWYWTCVEQARFVSKCDTPVFGFSQALTSEFLNNNTKGCWVGGGTPVNYSYDGSGSWGASIPMGRSYRGVCNLLCARVAQKIPEFRARPIMNFYGACVCLSTCAIHRVTGLNCGFALPDECVAELCFCISEITTTCWTVPDRIIITPRICECTCGDDERPVSTVYKAPKQNTISETYYTNGNA